jgi:hypothetical protein
VTFRSSSFTVDDFEPIVPIGDGLRAGSQMRGAATFDPRFNDKDQYPIAAKSGSGNTRNIPDKTTAKQIGGSYLHPPCFKCARSDKSWGD